MKQMLKSFWTDESGQGLTEYALIIALVSLGTFVVLGLFKDALITVFTNIKTKLNSVPAP